jgi:autotransporter-associated beta strand protein
LAPAGGGDVVIPDLDGSGGTTTVGEGVTAVVGGSGNGSYNGQITGQGGIRKQGNGRLVLSGNNDFTGGMTISGGVLAVGADTNLGAATSGITLDGGKLEFTNAMTLSAARAIEAVAAKTSTLEVVAGKVTYAGGITGDGTLVKSGTGILALTGSNAFTGTTRIDAGTLEFGAGASLASAVILVNSQAVLDVKAKTEGFELGSGQTLKGTGRIEGDLVVANGGTIAPGASTGTTTQSGTFTFGGGGTFQFEINDAKGTAGSTTNGWDLLVTDAVAFTATAENRFVIDIVSLTTGDPQVSGPVSNFNPAQPYEWRFVTASEEIANFNASVFSINTTLFQPNDWFLPGRGFSVGLASTGGPGLAIYYTPEPDAWLLAGLGLAAAGWAGRRRKTCGSGTP